MNGKIGVHQLNPASCKEYLARFGRMFRRNIVLSISRRKSKLKRQAGPYYGLLVYFLFPMACAFSFFQIHWLLIYLPEFSFLLGNRISDIPCLLPFFNSPPKSWKEALSYKPTANLEEDRFIGKVNHSITDFQPLKSTMRPKRSCSELEPGGIAILVISAAHNFKERQRIRNTWGSIARKEHLSSRIFMTFLVGLPSRARGDQNCTQKQLIKENEIHGDILQVTAEDIKFNIALKEYAGVAWLARHCSEGSHVFKTDDDVYLGIENLISFVKMRDVHQESVIYGWIEEAGCYPQKAASKTLRKASNLNKNYWLDLDYPFVHNPPFAVQSYLIAAAAVPKIVKAAFDGPFWAVQGDFYITGILAERAGIPKVHNRNFRMSFQESSISRFLLPRLFMKWRYQDTIVFSHIHAPMYHVKAVELQYIHSLF